MSAAFTLVELLVVIGIIALLISILLPSLRKAREHASAAKCLSNIRQLTSATILWANDRRGLMPAQATFSIYRYDPDRRAVVQVTTGSDFDENRRDSIADWIAWSRRVDAVTGENSTTADQNITYSALASYLGQRRRDHSSSNPNSANLLAPQTEAIFRCPSDDLMGRPSHADSSHGYYRYSYAINIAFCNPIYTKFTTPNSALRYGGGVFNGKITSIRNPSEKVLFICQEEKTLEDGSFNPQASLWTDPTKRIDMASSRHESKVKKSTYGYANQGNLVAEGHEDARGNIGFADGHAQFFSRKAALSAKHSGNPNPDPAAFGVTE